MMSIYSVEDSSAVSQTSSYFDIIYLKFSFVILHYNLLEHFVCDRHFDVPVDTLNYSGKE